MQDGFEVALYLHRRHFDSVPSDVRAASRALGRFRREAALTLDAIRVHRLRAVGMFLGYDDVWTPERAARLYGLVDGDANESAGEAAGAVSKMLSRVSDAPETQRERDSSSTVSS